MLDRRYYVEVLQGMIIGNVGACFQPLYLPLLCVLYACALLLLDHCAARTVRTISGSLRGVVVNPHHQAIEVFRGVPYSAPPPRFSPPLPVIPWAGVKTTVRFAPACPQWLPDISNVTVALKRIAKGRLAFLQRTKALLENQSEDCLYLNIYTPLHSEYRFVILYATLRLKI